MEKKYLKMKKRHQTVSRNRPSHGKNSQSDVFYKYPGRFFTRRTNFIEPDQLRSDEKSGLRRCWSRPASSVTPTFFVFRFGKLVFRSNSSNHESDESPFDQNSFRPNLFIPIFSPKFFTFSRKMKTERNRNTRN